MDRRNGLFDESFRNVGLAWLATVLLGVLALGHGLEGSYRWFLFTAIAVGIVLAPAITFRDPRVMPPWILIALVSAPVLDGLWAGDSVVTTFGVYLGVAAVALIVAVEIDRFTAARMNRPFAVVLVVLTTLAVAASWNVALWLSDVLLGTDYVLTVRSQDAANHELMIDFVFASVAGGIAGLVFGRYVLRASSPEAAPPDDRTDRSSDSETSSRPAFVRGRLGVSAETVRLLSRVLQAALIVLFLYGLARLDVTTVVNSAIAIAITFVPAVLDRGEDGFPLEPELVFWLTAAVFLHVLGSAGLYDLIGPLDSLTHAVSASIVAAAGYASVRAIDLYTDEIHLPTESLFVFILIFVLAFGVVWEIVEFTIDQTAGALGLEAVLAQHGIDDTILDLVFDFVGAVVVAASGSLYLTDLSRRIAAKLDD